MLTVTGTATGDVLDDFGKGPDEYPFVLMIQGLGGNDLLQDFDYASAVLDGGAGDDIVVAAAGSGSVGGAVPDGYTTPLVLLGGSGDDTLVFARFSSDTVTLNGGDGDDTLVMAGIAAGGVIDGGSGYDRLIMVTGLPSLSQSTVRGIERIDSLGAGGVSFTAGQLDGVTALSGTFNLNFGGTVRLAGKSLSGVTFNLSLDSGFNVRKSILADASVTSGFTVVTGGDIDRVTGGSGADTITVGTSSVAGEILDGGGGRDTLQVGPYADVTLAALRNIESFASNGGRFATAQLARPDTLAGSFFARGAGTLDFAGRTLTDFSLSFAGDSASHVVRFGETVTAGVFVTGGSGADTITGGAGADTILGGIGRDVLTGGTGADRFVFALGAGSADHAAAARVTDFSQAQGDRIGFESLGVPLRFVGSADFAEAGDIRSYVEGTKTWIEIDLDGDKVADQAYRLDGAITLTAADFAAGTPGAPAAVQGAPQVAAGADERLTGTGADETFAAVGSNAVVFAGAGDDLVYARAGGRFYGEDGADRIVASGGEIRIEGGAGNDVLQAGNALFKVFGGSGDDTLVATSAGTAGSLLAGGDGDDTLRIENFAAPTGLAIDGGAGRDALVAGRYLPSLAGATLKGIEMVSAMVEQGGRLNPLGIALAQVRSVGGLEGWFQLEDSGTLTLAGKELLGTILTCADGGNTIRMSATSTQSLSVVTGKGLDRAYFGQGDDGVTLVRADKTAGQVFDGGAGHDSIFIRGDSDTSAMRIVNFEVITGDFVKPERAGIVQRSVLAGADTIVNALKLADGGTLDLSGKTLENFTLTLSDKATTILADDSVTGAMLIIGGAASDRIGGGGGADTLRGGAGDDVLKGGGGIDTLTGGTGADRFVFAPGSSDGGRARADYVSDFSTADGDRIDLSGFDADPLAAGRQHLAFIGDAAFSAAGQVRFEHVLTQTYVEVDLDGDGKADLAVRLAGAIGLTAGDLVL